MTIRQLASQVYSLSVAGYFNGEKFTEAQLVTALTSWLRDEFSGGTYVGTIALPDGEWFIRYTHYDKSRRDGYDYYIPETREQNKALEDWLLARAGIRR